MTITQLNNKAIAVTGLPDDACNFELSHWNYQRQDYTDDLTLIFDSNKNGVAHIKGDRPHLLLPQGKWRILGFSQDLKEEDWTRVVEKMTWGIENYRNYAIPNDQNQYVGKTPTESGHSLLKSKDLDPLLNHLILIQ